MKINLHEYAKELEFWIKAFEPFVDRVSIGSLRETHERLLSSRDKRAAFDWSTPRPIKLQLATEYDRAAGDAEPVQVVWQFRGRFWLDPKDKAKRPLWDVCHLSTELEVHRVDPPALVLRFHHDMKNKDQLGPHAHVQVSEGFLEEAVGLKLAVPRFPAAALLPTDCLDMTLSEFFPRRWPREQSAAINFGLLRGGQMRRATAFAEALSREWRDNPKRTPVSLLQNCYFPDLHLT